MASHSLPLLGARGPVLPHQKHGRFSPGRTLLSRRSGGWSRTEPAGSSAPWPRGRGWSGRSPGSTPAGEMEGHCQATVTWVPTRLALGFHFAGEAGDGTQVPFTKLLFGILGNTTNSSALRVQLWKQFSGAEPSGRKGFTRHASS